MRGVGKESVGTGVAVCMNPEGCPRRYPREGLLIGRSTVLNACGQRLGTADQRMMMMGGVVVAGNGEVAGGGQSSTEHWKSPPESICLCFGVRCPRRGATVRSQRRTGLWRVHDLAHAGLDRWKGGNVTGIRGLGED